MKKRVEVDASKIHPVGHGGQYVCLIVLIMKEEYPSTVAPVMQSWRESIGDNPSRRHDLTMDGDSLHKTFKHDHSSVNYKKLKCCTFSTSLEHLTLPSRKYKNTCVYALPFLILGRADK